MRPIENERLRLAYLEAMGLKHWVPSATSGGHTRPTQASTASADEETESAGTGSSTHPEAKPELTTQQTEQSETRRDRPQPKSGWFTVGSPQPLLWVVADESETGNALLQKIQQACGVTAPAFVACAGGNESASDALSKVQTVVIFGDAAWRESGLSTLRKELDVRLIQTVGLDRLAEDPQAKARLWKQLQALI